MSHQRVQRGQEVPSVARWKGREGGKYWEGGSGGRDWCARKLWEEETTFQTGVRFRAGDLPSVLVACTDKHCSNVS